VISGLHEQVLSSLLDGVTVQDRDFNILYQNTAMVEAFGSHVGGKCYEIYERRDEICEGCGVRKVFRTGKPTMVLRTAFQEDGTISYWENACFPLFDEAGNIVAGVEVCRNISDRVSLEEEVKDRNIELGQLNKQLNRRTAQLQSTLAERREIERRLKDEIVAHKKHKKALQVTQFSVDNAMEAVHWVREDGSIYYVNDAACRGLGYSRQELLSMSISDINPNLPLSSWSQRWEEIRECKSRVFESIQKRKDGTLYPVEVAVNHIQLGDQEYTCAFIRDITERKEAEERQKRLMDELGEAYRDLKAAQNQIVLQDKMACIGQLAAGVAHEMNTPIGFIANNFETLNKYIDKFIKLLDLYGELPGLVYTGDADRRLHKVRQIEEACQAMKMDFVRKDTEALLRESKEGLRRVTNIVQNLRDFSRVDHAGGASLYDLNHGIKTTLTVARNEIKHHADVITDLADLPRIPCNAGQINQVLLNLLVNAAQAIATQGRTDPGSITIRTALAEACVVCQVSDDGPGIPSKLRKRVFEPFFTTKQVGEGIGLGLSISYDIIVNKHHGDLRVESQPGQGTTFTIKLPLEPAVPESTAQDASSQAVEAQ